MDGHSKGRLRNPLIFVALVVVLSSLADITKCDVSLRKQLREVSYSHQHLRRERSVSGSSPPASSEPTESTSEPEAETSYPNSKAEYLSSGEPRSEAEGTSEPESVAEGGNARRSSAENEPYAESEAETTASHGWEPEAEGVAEPEAEERPAPYEILLPPIGLMIIIVLGLLGLAVWTKRAFHIRWFSQTLAKLTKSGAVHILEPHKPQHGVFLPPSRDRSAVNTPTSSPRRIHVQESTLITGDALCDVEKPPEKPPLEQQQSAPLGGNKSKEDEFFTDFDLEVLGSLGSFNNRPMQLMRVSSPALLSLALCPMTLYMYEPLVTYFWPPDKFAALPDINEAIACFLAPAGLVYATSFGFAFSQALTKQQAILAKMTHELGLLDQIVTIASKLNLPSLRSRMDIYKAVKAETIFVTLQVMNTPADSFKNPPGEDVSIRIWSILDQLRNIQKTGQESFDLDLILVNKIVSHVLELNSICSDRMGTLHARIHPLKWAFLESLGFFSFFGILLLQAQSYRTELTMCIMTVFSISLLCYVVSDLDSPFCGFFRVDLSALPEVVMRTRKAYELAKQGHNILVTYPRRDTTGFD